MSAQIIRLFSSLTLRQRLLIAAAAIASIGAIWWLNQWNRERAFQPLFSGLSSEDAGVVVAKLKEAGVEYRISENGSIISAPVSRIPELRIQLATAGIPKTGRIGYELFDKNNFGITDFAEQVNYRRAIEGETERSILTLTDVESVRVHITPAKDSIFTDAKQPAKASVVLKLRPGRKLNPPNVDAIAHLLSSAVQGLEPDHVSVVDGSGKLLMGTEKPVTSEEAEAAEKALTYRQRLEKDLIDKINATLEPLVGAKRFRTGVSIECDFTSGEQSEETFDPEKSVVSNSQKSDEIGASATVGGQPGTASNLPRPVTRSAASGNPLTRKTENTTYQNSRVVRKTKLPQGAVQRMSIAVVLDHQLRWEVEKGKAKKILTPPSAEQMKSIKDLITGIAGVDAKRGDSLVVESLPFDVTLGAEPPAGLVPIPPATPQSPISELIFGIPKDKLLLYGSAGGGVLLLLAGCAFWFMRKKAKKRLVAAELTQTLDAGSGESRQLGSGGNASGTGPDDRAISEADEQEASALAALEARQTKEVLGSIKMPPRSKKAQVLTRHIAEESKKDSNSMAQIVRTWLSEES